VIYSTKEVFKSKWLCNFYLNDTVQSSSKEKYMKVLEEGKNKRKSRLEKIIVFAIIMLLIGTVWQRIMVGKEMKILSPKGEIFNINNHNMYINSIGSGRNTVVFVAGSGTPSSFTDFYRMQMELKPYAETVSFDNAGFGWSEKTDLPRTIDVLTEELHELLKKSGQPSPYILVGHSLASLEVIHFAQKYPNEVKGIVLLDGGSPEFYAYDSEVKSYILNRISAGLRITGIARVLGSLDVKLPLLGENLRYNGLSKDIKKIDLAMYYRYLGNSMNLEYIKNINENAAEVMKNGHLNNIPLVIISSDSGEDWEKSQKELINWSNFSSQETLPNSSHYIHWTNTEYVVEKIKSLIFLDSY
jgi:pimeloyl-ACP methyl ester carboxylesterase